MSQDLAHKRPYLLASLFFGLSYPALSGFALPEMFSIAWKMAGVGFLVPYALRRHHSGDFAILAAVLAFCSLGDGLIELDMLWGAIAFAIAHVIAIWLYARHWRKQAALSQRLLAVTVVLCTPFIAFALPATSALGVQADLYRLCRGDGRLRVEQPVSAIPRGHRRDAVFGIRPADLRAHGAVGGILFNRAGNLVSLFWRHGVDRHRRGDNACEARAFCGLAYMVPIEAR
jgi:YhhN family